jgi:hypothetical protein
LFHGLIVFVSKNKSNFDSLKCFNEPIRGSNFCSLWLCWEGKI